MAWWGLMNGKGVAQQQLMDEQVASPHCPLAAPFTSKPAALGNVYIIGLKNFMLEHIARPNCQA